MDMNQIVGRIKKKRKELGYSYQELAKKTKMSKSTLQRYETGAIKNIPLDKLEVLANALDVSPIYLLGIKNEISPIYPAIRENKTDVSNFVNEDISEYEIFTHDEKNLIYTYRELSEEGKKLIDYIIKNELS